MSARRTLALVAVAFSYLWVSERLMDWFTDQNFGLWPDVAMAVFITVGFMSVLAAVAPLPPREDATHASRKGGEK